MRPWARWTARMALVAVVSAAAGGGLSGIAFAGTGGDGNSASTPLLGGNGLLAPLGIPDAVCGDSSALLGIAVVGCRGGAAAASFSKRRAADGEAGRGLSGSVSPGAKPGGAKTGGRGASSASTVFSSAATSGPGSSALRQTFGDTLNAPGLGAGVTALWLAFRPVSRHVGLTMFLGVAAFGAATIVFGLTRSFWVAMTALVILGVGDMISVFIRSMLVQLDTPDEIRGRVSAVNSVFVGASNELGEFESGFTAAWLGLVPAIVLGGAATLLVTALWARVLFPSLWRMQTFEQLN